jgi:hypothetical protein
MLHAYRLVYPLSEHTPRQLWEWEQPWIHHLIMNADSFHTAVVEQQYCRDWEVLRSENARIWDVHYRSRPLYDHLDTWEMWLAEYRQIILDLQEIAGDV